LRGLYPPSRWDAWALPRRLPRPRYSLPRMIPVSSRASNYSSMAAGHKSDRRHGRQFVRGARTHRDCRWNAGEAGANSRLQRIWAAHGLKPYRVKTKLSNDPRFAAKVQDVVGLYHAPVLSVDEQSRIQALDRTQPGLPHVGRHNPSDLCPSTLQLPMDELKVFHLSAAIGFNCLEAGP
jgi:hypothetical protein